MSVPNTVSGRLRAVVGGTGSKPATNLLRFQYGFYALALWSVVGVFLVLTGDEMLFYGLVGLVFAGGFALLGYGVGRRSRVAWFLGMLYPGMFQVIFGLPLLVDGHSVLGLLQLGIGVCFLYFGLTGRSALGDTSTRETGTATGDDVEGETSEDGGLWDGADDDADAATKADDGDASEADTTASEPSAGTDGSPTASTADAPDDEATTSGTGPSGAGDGPAGDLPSPPSDTEQRPEVADDEASAKPDPTAGGPDDQSSSTAEDRPSSSVPDEYASALADPDPETRQATVENMVGAVDEGEVAPGAAVSLLADRLESDDVTTVKTAACEVLGDIGTDDARDVLEEHRLDPDTEVSRAAARAVRELRTD